MNNEQHQKFLEFHPQIKVPSSVLNICFKILIHSMHETSARAWYTGKTQRNQVEREVGGGDQDGEYM